MNSVVGFRSQSTSARSLSAGAGPWAIAKNRLESLLEYSWRPADAISRNPDGRTALGFAFEGRAGQVYNEEAFRHFFSLERKRAERSNRACLLLLVSLAGPRRLRANGMSTMMAGRLFSTLTECVREVDFVGWYREGHVAAAVLAQGADAPMSVVSEAIMERVTATLRQRLPSRVAERLQVRVLHIRRRGTC
jgi:hypothetical protein